MNKKKARKLTLNTETLHMLTLKRAAGGFTDTRCVTDCAGTCQSVCGSCNPCTHYPCPVTNAITCPC